MKKIVILLLMPLLIFLSCSNGGDGSGDETDSYVYNVNDDAGCLSTKRVLMHVGDVILSDGTAVSKSQELTAEQKNKVVSVIFYAGNEKGTIGKGLLGVGVVQSSSSLEWCTFDASAAKIKITPIVCSIIGDRSSGKAEYHFTFSGDINGSDNLEQIGQFLTSNRKTDDTSDSSKYPAFYYAKNYKSQDATVVGTAYESGWYLPTIAELAQLRNNMAQVNKMMEKIGKDKFPPSWQKSWLTSSSQSASTKKSSSDCYSALRMTDGYCSDEGKKYGGNAVYVCAIRRFD